jgi:hypothetical protein
MDSQSPYLNQWSLKKLNSHPADLPGTECVAVPISAFFEAGLDVGQTWSKNKAVMQKTKSMADLNIEDEEEEEVLLNKVG